MPYNPQNVTAPCDEPAEITDEQRAGSRRTISQWCAQQEAAGEFTHDEAKDVLLELLQMLGVHPDQKPAQLTSTMPPAALNSCSYTSRR